MKKSVSHRFPCRTACALLIVALCGTGCASKYGAQTTQVNHYPDCYTPINELRQNEFVVQKSVAGGAAAGALLGALVGYAATGKASGAIAGAAVGGVAGGTAGGLYADSNQKSNDAQRLSEYNAQLAGSIRETDKATAAARVARQCYENKFTAAASDFKAGRLTRDQFDARYREVAQGLEEAANILGEANKNSSQLVADYNKAVTQESTRVAAKPAAARSTKTAETQQVAQLRQKTTTMQRSVSAGAEEERLLRERLAATHQQAKDLMS